MKKRPQGALLLFLYEVSIVVLFDFIAILLTPGIFLTQIVNTNMYVIDFHNKNIIKMHFLKVGFLKFQTYLNHSLSIAIWRSKLRWHHFPTMFRHLIFKKTIQLKIIIYTVKHFKFFWYILLNNFLKIHENQNWKSDGKTLYCIQFWVDCFFFPSEINIKGLPNRTFPRLSL